MRNPTANPFRAIPVGAGIYMSAPSPGTSISACAEPASTLAPRGGEVPVHSAMRERSQAKNRHESLCNDRVPLESLPRIAERPACNGPRS